MITAGIDVGSSAVKTAIVQETAAGPRVLETRTERLRHRNVQEVAEEAFRCTLEAAGIRRDELAYVATTGEGDLVAFRTGHFYSMTAHAKGGKTLVPEARAVLDVGALHARAIVVDERGRVESYRMTSQCASGSGQFLENIGRYLGVALEEIGPLSERSEQAEKCSSICAVLAETDVINMVSRGIPVESILKGIHLSMAQRFVKLLQAAGARGRVAVTGGLSVDVGLRKALAEEAAKAKVPIEFEAPALGPHAGALGAAVWGAYRVRKLKKLGRDAAVR